MKTLYHQKSGKSFIFLILKKRHYISSVIFLYISTLQAGKHRLFLNILLFGKLPVSCRTYLLLSVLSLAHHNLRYNQKRRCTLSNAQNYLYNFNKFVEHALRLQAQSERKLSLKCINISGYTLNIHLLFSYIIMVITRNTNSAHTTYIIG